MRQRHLERILWLLGLSGVIAVVLFPLIAGGGVPAFQQDWAWPADRSQCIPLAIAGFEPWHDIGLGIPAVYPESYIYHALAGSSCIVFAPRLGLVALLSAALGFCAYGYRRLYYALMARESLPSYATIATTIAVVSIANPIIINKLQAGHIKFLLAYAILPWIALVSLQTQKRTAALTLGVLLGAATLDPQYLAFGTFVAIVFSLYSKKRNWFSIAAAVAIAVLINLPQIVPVLSPSGTASLNVLAPVLFWQRSQSGHVSDALRFIGYIGGYASHALPRWLLLLYWLVPIAALILPLLRFRRRFLFIAACAVVGVYIVAGWNTPLAPLWTMAFSHFAWLAVFRELYNGVALIMISFAAGLSIGLTLLRERAKAVSQILCACLIAISFAAGSQAAHGIPLYVPAASETHMIEAISAERAYGRFATVPGTPPVTNGHFPDNAGLSPWVLSFERHGVLFSPTPSSVEMYTHALLRDNDPTAMQWLSRDAVSFVQYLDDWRTRSIAQADPAAKRAERKFLHDFTVRGDRSLRTSAELIAVEPFTAQPGGLDTSYSGARDLGALQGGREVTLQHFSSDVSPATGWARTALVPVLPSWIYSQPLGIFTLRSKAQLELPNAVVVAGDSLGSISARGCSVRLKISKHFKVFQCAANPVFSGEPPIAVSDARAGAVIAASYHTTGAPGLAILTSNRPWHVTASVHALPGSAVVLRESYADGWTSSLPDARHLMVDGYANAWIVQKPFDGVVDFTYVPARRYFSALATSLVTLIISAAFIVAARKERVA